MEVTLLNFKKDGIMCLIPRGYSKTKEKNPILNVIKKFQIMKLHM